MKKAFVFGKFLPFHKGHEAMIQFALQRCDFLSVLVCCSDKEEILDSVRKSWIEKTCKQQKNIEVRVLNYLESELPNTSASSKEVSQIWAQTLKKIFPEYSLVITSETYGDFVAEFMGIEHIAFDIPRNMFPVSATAVKNDIFLNWKFLPEAVKPDFAIKIVILGTESTGKTTLAKFLSDYFKCSLVPEAGRALIENSNAFVFEDLHKVAEEHAKRIDTAMVGKTPLIIMDTDIHITKSYARCVFEKKLAVTDVIYETNKADLYLYLSNDVPLVQDGTRLNETDRNVLDFFHRQVLDDHSIKIAEINGSWTERYDSAVLLIQELIENTTKSIDIDLK